jgi:hypothetical protein
MLCGLSLFGCAGSFFSHTNIVSPVYEFVSLSLRTPYSLSLSRARVHSPSLVLSLVLSLSVHIFPSTSLSIHIYVVLCVIARAVPLSQQKKIHMFLLSFSLRLHAYGCVCIRMREHVIHVYRIEDTSDFSKRIIHICIQHVCAYIYIYI